MYVTERFDTMEGHTLVISSQQAPQRSGARKAKVTPERRRLLWVFVA